jgi:VCBS repeat-containing protein
VVATLNATDVDGDALTYEFSSPEGGAFSRGADGKVTFTAAENFHGTASATYTVSDGVATDAGTISVAVASVNDAPKAVNDSLTSVDEDQTVILTPLDNDTDVDGDLLTIVEARATFGTATVQQVSGTTVVSYTASSDSFDKLATGASTSDTITYKVSDGNGGFSSATVALKITGLNDGVVILGTNQAETITGRVVSGREQDETIEAFNGNDVVFGRGGADRLIGGNGVDMLYGENGWDELYGDHGNDVLDGGAGLDFLDGGLGDDRLTGGADADIFYFGKANGRDTIEDFQVGVDDLQFSTGVSIKTKSMIDTDGNGSMDATQLQLSTGSVVVNNVFESDWALLA